MLNIRLSKLNIYTSRFREKNDEREHVIIFSCRKCMGVKLNVDLFGIIQSERWELLPDELFTLLLYYEMVLPGSPDELSAFYNFRALVKARMDTGGIPSVEGLSAALGLYEKAPAEQQVIRLSVTLPDADTVPLFSDLLRQVAANDAFIVRNITVNLGSPAIINDPVLLGRFRAFSKKVPLNFRLTEEDHALAGELYNMLREHEIWGDYFFDLNEYTAVRVTGDTEVQHLPLAVKAEEMPREQLTVLNRCIEKMIFIKYKVWPQSNN